MKQLSKGDECRNSDGEIERKRDAEGESQIDPGTRFWQGDADGGGRCDIAGAANHGSENGGPPGLETDEEHFTVYDGMPMEIQASLLQTTLDNYYEYTYGIPRVQIYLDGDLALGRALWEESLGWLDPEAAKMLDDRLIHDRNHIMVERMLPLMRRGSTFVGVGAAHMAGEQGILRLLEQQGFTVTRLH